LEFDPDISNLVVRNISIIIIIIIIIIITINLHAFETAIESVNHFNM
jgi:hypothetical protein